MPRVDNKNQAHNLFLQALVFGVCPFLDADPLYTTQIQLSILTSRGTHLS